MCIYCKSGPYSPPDPKNYRPWIDSSTVKEGYDTYDAKIANSIQSIYNTCLTLRFKESYYVSITGQLEGYCCINYPMRIWNAFRNWISKGERERQVVDRVTEAFEFILNINCSEGGIWTNDSTPDDFRVFHNTYFNHGIKYYCSYTCLAETVIAKFPKEKYLKLYTLAHRIIHERAERISVHITRPEGIVQCNNIKKNVEGTPFEATTVWSAL